MKKAHSRQMKQLARASARRHVLIALVKKHKQGDVTVVAMLNNSAFMKLNMKKINQ